MPSSSASAFRVASSRRTPKRRSGSDSPRRAAPIASIASCGVAFRNEAISEERPRRPFVKLERSSPASPAALPKVPKTRAPSRASCFDWPNASAAESANARTASEASPKICRVAEIASSRSEAEPMDFATAAPTATPIAVAAIATFLSCRPTFREKLPNAPSASGFLGCRTWRRSGRLLPSQLLLSSSRLMIFS
jgi:hypothetical protein